MNNEEWHQPAKSWQSTLLSRVVATGYYCIMKLSIADVRTDRHWRSATGLDQKRFAKLLGLLPGAYPQLYGQSIEQRQAECPQEPTLNTYENLLLFTLVFLKSALSFDLVDFTTGMDGSTATRNRAIGLLVIKAALSESGHIPKTHSVLLDATEQRTQRPTARPYQKQMYSSKKSPYR